MNRQFNLVSTRETTRNIESILRRGNLEQLQEFFNSVDPIPSRK